MSRNWRKRTKVRNCRPGSSTQGSSNERGCWVPSWWHTLPPACSQRGIEDERLYDDKGVPSGSRERTRYDPKRPSCTRTKTRCSRAGWRRRRRSEHLPQLVGVRNSNHALDLRIRSGRRRRASNSKEAREASVRHSIRLPWLPNCPSAEPFRAGLESLGLTSQPTPLAAGVSLGLQDRRFAPI